MLVLLVCAWQVSRDPLADMLSSEPKGWFRKSRDLGREDAVNCSKPGAGRGWVGF